MLLPVAPVEPLVVAVPAGAKEFEQTATIMQAAGAEIGLDLEIEAMQASDFGALFYDPAKREGVDFVATQGYLETPGVLGYPSLFVLPAEQGGIFNWSGYADDEVTAHMMAARNASDAATASLVESFYRELKTDGASKAESLRRAQVTLLAQAQFRHPSYWAPYLMIGNWM